MSQRNKDYYIGRGEPEAGEIIVKQLKTVAVLTEEPWESPHLEIQPHITPAPGDPIQPSGLQSPTPIWHIFPFSLTYTFIHINKKYIHK